MYYDVQITDREGNSEIVGSFSTQKEALEKTTNMCPAGSRRDLLPRRAYHVHCEHCGLDRQLPQPPTTECPRCGDRGERDSQITQEIFGVPAR